MQKIKQITCFSFRVQCTQYLLSIQTPSPHFITFYDVAYTGEVVPMGRLLLETLMHVVKVNNFDVNFRLF